MHRPDPRLAPWLVPAFAGSFGTAWVGITLVAMLGPTEPLLGGRLWNWIFAMLLGTLIVLVLVAVRLWVDVLLARWSWQRPTGWRAWLAAAAAPLLLAAVYTLYPPGRHDAALPWLAAVVVPIVAVAGAVRLGLGGRARD